MTNRTGCGRHILLVSFLEPWSMGDGKGAPSLFETLAGYARAGWSVDYVTFHKRPVLGVAHEQSIDLKLDGVRVHRFEIPRWRWLPRSLQAKLDRLILFPLWSLPTILRVMRKRPPAVFYAYEASAVIAARLVRVLRAKRYVLIHRIQGVSVLGDFYRSLWFMARKLESLLSLRARADGYIMTDDGTLGDRVWRYWNRHVSPDHLLHIRNGLGEQLLSVREDRDAERSALGLDASLIYLLMVSRLDPIKRVDRGVRAMAALGPRPDVKLLIAGGGEDMPRLEALAKTLGVFDRVTFLGGVDRGKVARLMNAADIFLSLYDVSNCGNPLFEALRSRMPIVTLDNGATGSVITNGVNGLLLPVDDDVRLNDALERLIADPGECARLSAGAEAWAADNLVSWQARMEREIKWLSQFLDR